MNMTTPRCRLELEDGTLLWDVNNLLKSWKPEIGDLINFQGSQYEVTNMKFEFGVQEGAADPDTGVSSPDFLTVAQTIIVELKP